MSKASPKKAAAKKAAEKAPKSLADAFAIMGGADQKANPIVVPPASAAAPSLQIAINGEAEVESRGFTSSSDESNPRPEKTPAEEVVHGRTELTAEGIAPSAAALGIRRRVAIVEPVQDEE